MNNNKLMNFWLIFGIIIGFVMILFFILTYLDQNIMCDFHCRVRHEIFLVITFMSFFGVFVGSLTYYFISEQYERKIDKFSQKVESTLKFLDRDERLVVKALINLNGITTQVKIKNETNLSRVKLSRILKKLEKKNIIYKTQKGMTNEIIFVDDLKHFFIN